MKQYNSDSFDFGNLQLKYTYVSYEYSFSSKVFIWNAQRNRALCHVTLVETQFEWKNRRPIACIFQKSYFQGLASLKMLTVLFKCCGNRRNRIFCHWNKIFDSGKKRASIGAVGHVDSSRYVPGIYSNISFLPLQ